MTCVVFTKTTLWMSWSTIIPIRSTNKILSIAILLRMSSTEPRCGSGEPEVVDLSLKGIWVNRSCYIYYLLESFLQYCQGNVLQFNIFHVIFFLLE